MVEKFDDREKKLENNEKDYSEIYNPDGSVKTKWLVINGKLGHLVRKIQVEIEIIARDGYKELEIYEREIPIDEMRGIIDGMTMKVCSDLLRNAFFQHSNNDEIEDINKSKDDTIR